MEKIKKFIQGFKEKIKNLFKKKESKEDQKTLKFKSFKMPKLIMASQINFKKGLLFFIPLIIGTLGIVFGISSNKQNENVKDVIIIDHKVEQKVYLLSDENFVVPLTFSLDEKLSYDEYVLDVFEMIKDDKTYQDLAFKGYIPKDTKLNKISLDKNILTLDVSSHITKLPYKNIRRSIEALTYTFLNFENVEGLKLSVDDQPLTTLENGYTLPILLNKTIGINKDITSLNNLSSLEEVTLLYKKEIDSNQYYVPVTIDAKRGTTKVNSIINGIQYNPSVSRGLKKLNEYKFINSELLPTISNNMVSFEVNKDALIDEVTISRTLYDLIRLTFDYSNIDLSVNLLFQGNDYKVDGIFDEATSTVASSIANEVSL